MRDSGAVPSLFDADLAQGPKDDTLPTERYRAPKLRFLPFFKAVKEKTARAWHPEMARAYRARPGEHLGRGNRYTEVCIRVAADGAASATIVLSSGIAALDNEAVGAVERAQPYPPPPRALAPQGVAAFHFGFLYDLAARSVP